jgi:hypothetical protein
VFHWLDPAPTLLGQAVPASHFAVPLAVALAAALLACWRFRRIDL